MRASQRAVRSGPVFRGFAVVVAAVVAAVMVSVGRWALERVASIQALLTILGVVMLWAVWLVVAATIYTLLVDGVAGMRSVILGRSVRRSRGAGAGPTRAAPSR